MINKYTLKQLGIGTLFAAGLLSLVYVASIKPRNINEQRMNDVFKHSAVITVQSGDILDQFAKQYINDCNCGINYLTVREQIRVKNNLKNSTIYAGQKLEIPIYKGKN